MVKSNILTAIDIGTSSIKILVGQKEKNTSLNILVKEEIPHSVGVRKGEVYDSKKVGETLAQSVKNLQKNRGIKLKKVIASINGPHLFSFPSQGLVSVSRADQKISQEDVQRVLKASEAVHLPSNKEILNVHPQEFIVDGEGGIKDARGLEGIRLEAKVLLIGVFSPVLENLANAIYNANLEVVKITPSVLAASRALLSPEQKELGVAVIDMGAGTTSLSIFSEGSLKDFTVFPLGSANITNDIAIGLRTEIKVAERIKREFASFKTLQRKRRTKKDKIEIPEKGISFSRSFLENIVESRVSEIFHQVAKLLKKTSKDIILPGGVLLTGGGSLLPGLVDFAKKKFELPCYAADPKGIQGIDAPNFSAAGGLLLKAADYVEEDGSGGFYGRKESFGIIKKIFKTFLP